MIVGHYATALLPWSRAPRAPLWLYLVCAQALDFLWLGLAAAGVEAPSPSSILDVTFANLRVQMVVSHDALPVLGWAALTAGVVLAVTRDGRVALWCGALVVGHLLCDLLSGFGHTLCGAGSPAIGLDLYGRAPRLALVIEAVFGAACVLAFAASERRQGRPLTIRRQAALHAVFVGGALAWLPTATTPLGRWLGG